MIVIDSNGNKSEYKQRFVVNSLVNEADIDKDKAKNIATSVTNALRNLDKDEIFTSEIREKVKFFLEKNHKQSVADDYDVISIGKHNLENLFKQRVDLNANQPFNTDTIGKNIIDDILFKYTLKHIYTEEEKNAHLDGYIYYHDASSTPLKINCFIFSPVPVFEKGLYISGDRAGTITTPPKHLSTAINMIREMFTACGNEQFAGALGIPLFNVWLAPFARGLSVKEIRQCLQSFVYDMNQSLRRSGEITFSNINLEFAIPEFLKNEPAVGPEGKIVGSLGDYEAEAQLIADIIMDIFYEGDAGKKPFIFPNCAFSLRDEHQGKPRYEALVDKSFMLHAKYPSFYWINQDIEEYGGHSIAMGCRSALHTNWTGDWKKDTIGTGNSSFFTLNLPRYGYLADDIDDVYNYIDKYIDLGFEVARKRTEIFKKNNANGMYPFTAQLDIHGEPFYNIEHATHAIGVIGFNNMLINLGIEDGLLDNEGLRITEDMLNYMNSKKKDYTDRTGLRTSVIASPAEYACRKLAQIDIEEFGHQELSYSGTIKDPYYDNSNHVISQNIDLLEKTRIEAPLSKYLNGGSIIHNWLGSYPSTKGLKDLVFLQKEHGAFYITTTNSFTCCNKCTNNSNGVNESCPSCGSLDTVSYDKITGYISPINTFNKSKQYETLKGRRRHIL